MLFSIYYINFAKVYEIKMMLSNVIGKSIDLQSGSQDETEEKIKAKLGAQFLNFFSSSVEAQKRTLGTDSQKVLESFEIKMTKSTVLNEVIEKSSKVIKFDEKIEEGMLVRVEDVKLTLENEMELRTVKLFSNGTFKGLKVPEAGGLDINNVFNSIFKDYSYKLKGMMEDKEGILIKIPMTFENEFENLYRVDDLFIGKVTVIGIYKGKLKVDELKNSFQFFQELGENSENNEDKVQEIHNSQYEEHVNSIQFTSSNDGKEYHYIDVLAIIQQINSETGDV
jgi:hypothetical protein